jgi:hypothetical protein
MPETTSGATKSLDPAVLDRLSSLSLVARTVVEGFLAGQHRSSHLGSSVEFAQHREYTLGTSNAASTGRSTGVRTASS